MRLKVKKLLGLLICTLFVTTLLPITARADIGPKPSIHITFEGLGDELCYGTLLSKTESTGPSSVWDGTERDARHNENDNYYYASFDYETWKVFAEYEDVDGYYFLQEGWQVNETKELAWTYYPPSSFKILLYFPEQNAFFTSGIYERYAFDSYYTVDLTDLQIPDGGELPNQPLLVAEEMEAVKSYDYSKEIYSLVVRIFATIVIEIAVALVFGFTKKEELLLLTIVNVITQIILNVLLNVINYKSGHMAFMMGYFFFEIIVFMIEATIYHKFMPKLSKQPKGKWVYLAYAFLANAMSFAVGYTIAKIMPGIF